ncbi:GNAT family N-acetyltransferase [Noviherbaspirillum aridicola]|nr:GNAT family N-acetyltransferase [Noviherbaspirillum aridicola]
MNQLPALVNRGGHALRAELFGMIHARRDTRPFIRNVTADIDILRVDDVILPATITYGEPGNAWICSPRATWGDGMPHMLRERLGPALSRCSAGLFGLFGGMLDRASIDRAVFVNNWLIDTCFHPVMSRRTLNTMIERAVGRWPQHALWIRSLNAERNAALIASLRDAGFALLPTRQVWVFDGIGLKLRMGAGLERDLARLQRTSMWTVGRNDIYPADFPRIAALHAAMDTAPHGWAHPHYTAHFMQYWHQAGLMEFRGFRDDEGRLQAVAGIFRIGDSISVPILGCNPALPRATQVYRLLMTRLLEETMLGNATLCLGPGQTAYKRERGGRPMLEYSAVLTRHLPPARRRAVAVLESVANRFYAPLIRRL